MHKVFCHFHFETWSSKQAMILISWTSLCCYSILHHYNLFNYLIYTLIKRVILKFPLCLTTMQLKRMEQKTAQLHPSLKTILDEYKWSACCFGYFWIVGTHTWDQESNRIQWRNGKSLFLQRIKFRSLPLTSYFLSELTRVIICSLRVP
jgi:hypothetical protein